MECNGIPALVHGIVSYLRPDLVNEGIPFFRGFAPKDTPDSQNISPPQQSVLPNAQETRDVVGHSRYGQKYALCSSFDTLPSLKLTRSSSTLPMPGTSGP